MHKYVFLIFIYSFNLYSNLSGVIHIGVLDSLGNVISKASGFVAYDAYTNEKYIFTSFHLLNINLILAEKIIDLKTNNSLDILAYDEVYDVLVLDANNYDDYFYFSNSCSNNNLLVAGYYKQNLRYANANETKEIDKGIKSINTYLPNGFSGGVVLNDKALVCGMLVLSSEGNSKSIYVDESILKNSLKNKNLNKTLISSIRKELGLEVEIDNNYDLKMFLNTKTNNKQSVIVLKPELNNEIYKIENASNFVLKTKKSVNGIILTNVNNVMLSRFLSTNSLNINNASNLSIVASSFLNKESIINISKSKDLNISGNKFNNINGIYISEDSSNYRIEDNFTY